MRVSDLLPIILPPPYYFRFSENLKVSREVNLEPPAAGKYLTGLNFRFNRQIFRQLGTTFSCNYDLLCKVKKVNLF